VGRHQPHGVAQQVHPSRDASRAAPYDEHGVGVAIGRIRFQSGAGVSDNDRSQAVLETATRAAERAVAEAAVAEADAAILAAHGVVQAAETERAIALLDRERCILCDRCTRFADEVAGVSADSVREWQAKAD
jgi:hypothetical protein